VGAAGKFEAALANRAGPAGSVLLAVNAPSRKAAVGEDGRSDEYPFEQAGAVVWRRGRWIAQFAQRVGEVLAILGLVPEPGEPVFAAEDQPVQRLEFSCLAVSRFPGDEEAQQIAGGAQVLRLARLGDELLHRPDLEEEKRGLANSSRKGRRAH
jgi:hypothetical protein